MTLLRCWDCWEFSLTPLKLSLSLSLCFSLPSPLLPCAAMGSNLTFQSRNVLSKKVMIKGEAGMACLA